MPAADDPWVCKRLRCVSSLALRSLSFFEYEKKSGTGVARRSGGDMGRGSFRFVGAYRGFQAILFTPSSQVVEPWTEMSSGTMHSTGSDSQFDDRM